MSYKAIVIICVLVVCVVSICIFTIKLHRKSKKEKHPLFTVGNVNLKMNKFNLNLNEEISENVIDNPVVKVDSESNQCFVFVKVDKQGDCDKVAQVEYDGTNWKLLQGTKNVFYTYVSEEDAEIGKQLPPLFSVQKKSFDDICIDDEEQDARLNFSAYGIQTDGFLSPIDAWINVNVFD